ncbi:hypothetical protein FGO68_gene15982 [Halteria grandinella]|uniref:Uncharacterized protein n=1 Tax=Halteria grandinella TaxID=5974 RepID=A0A8J8NQA7_HALGN|nr:hypothetical protein FGO68_gene15982 [Halteria grandinella]
MPSLKPKKSSSFPADYAKKTKKLQHKIEENLNKIGEKYYMVHKAQSKIEQYEKEIALMKKILEEQESKDQKGESTGLSVLDLVDDFTSVERPFRVQHYQQLQQQPGQ